MTVDEARKVIAKLAPKFFRSESDGVTVIPYISDPIRKAQTSKVNPPAGPLG